MRWKPRRMCCDFGKAGFPDTPVKRAGGRRYYRPADVALLSGIRHLLHEEGMTIRGVQKILREQGVRHVAALAGGIAPDEGDAELIAAMQPLPEERDHDFDDEDGPVQLTFTAIESAQVVALETALSRGERTIPRPEPEMGAPAAAEIPAASLTLGGLTAALSALPRPLAEAQRQAFAAQAARLAMLHHRMTAGEG